MNNSARILLGGLLTLLVLGFWSCRTDPIPPFTLESISKDQRELLGKRLEIAILTQPTLYPIRSAAGADNEILYDYLQQYYNQATYFFKLDRSAPIEDRWNPNKLWRVRILVTDIPQAFTFPGGDFYISEGMLSLLNNEAELFALMSFEATLMQEKIVLKELTEKYAAGTFIDLLELGEAEGGLNERDLLNQLMVLQYEATDLINIDQLTQQHICNSSAFNKNSLRWLVESLELNDAENWLEQKSYEGRNGFLQDLSNGSSCGARISDGSYEKSVLALL